MKWISHLFGAGISLIGFINEGKINWQDQYSPDESA